jgi:hypothetical protein
LREEVSYLADGRRLAVCTDCARFIRDRELNTRIVGYVHDDNPSAASELAFGHDFAIVDEPFIVDPWVVIVVGESRRAVSDLQDPEDSAEIMRLYGDPAKWRELEVPSLPRGRPIEEPPR